MTTRTIDGESVVTTIKPTTEERIEALMEEVGDEPFTRVSVPPPAPPPPISWSNPAVYEPPDYNLTVTVEGRSLGDLEANLRAAADAVAGMNKAFRSLGKTAEAILNEVKKAHLESESLHGVSLE